MTSFSMPSANIGKNFEQGKLFDWPYSSKQEFRTKFAQELPTFKELIYRAIDVTQGYMDHPAHYYDESWKAKTISVTLQGMLIDEFGHELIKKGKFKRYFYGLDDHRIYFKKLDKAKWPLNNDTKNSEDIECRRGDNHQAFFTGYVSGIDNFDVKGIYTISIVGDKIDWVIDLDSVDSTANTVHINTDVIIDPTQNVLLAKVKNDYGKAKQSG